MTTLTQYRNLTDAIDLSGPLNIRAARPEDVTAVMSIDEDAYTAELLEGTEAMLTKLVMFPAGCRIAEVWGEPVGYLIGHPWVRNDSPALNCKRFVIPPCADTFFIHSVTILKMHQRSGIGTVLAETALRVARELGYLSSSLVCVQNARGFWAKFGFKTVRNLPDTTVRKLAGYGNSAEFMATNGL